MRPNRNEKYVLYGCINITINESVTMSSLKYRLRKDTALILVQKC